MSFEMQVQLRRNAEDIRTAVSGLSLWEDEIRGHCKTMEKQPVESKDSKIGKDASTNTRKCVAHSTTNDAEGKEHGGATKQEYTAVVEKRTFARDLNSISDYYAAWDRYKEDISDADDSGSPVKQRHSVSSKPARGQVQTSKVVNTRTVVRCNNNLKQNSQSNLVNQYKVALERLVDLKETANNLYSQRSFSKAAGKYKCALESVEALLCGIKNDMKTPEGCCANEEIINHIIELQGQLYLNLGAAHLENKNYDACIDACTRCLTFQPNSTRALRRRAKASVRLRKWDEAINDLTTVRNLKKKNPELGLEDADSANNENLASHDYSHTGKNDNSLELHEIEEELLKVRKKKKEAIIKKQQERKRAHIKVESSMGSSGNGELLRAFPITSFSKFWANKKS